MNMPEFSGAIHGVIYGLFLELLASLVIWTLYELFW
jgi:hypothetical protein